MLKERKSNLEALRIVSMMMVVLVHIDGASLGLPSIKGDLQALTSRDVWCLAVESITIIGVNCFTLISGYFGIKLRLKGVLSFLFQCVFYSVLIASLAPWLLGIAFSWKEWGESWLVLSHTDLWYVPAYFCLMLLSPLLNAGVDKLSRREFAWILVIFLLFNIWSGWWWDGAFNPTGYTVMQLILMYLIGRYIGKYIGKNIEAKEIIEEEEIIGEEDPRLMPRHGVEKRRHLKIQGKRRYLAMMGSGGYVAAIGMVFLSSLYLEPVKAFAYNSPMVILASVSFFILFLSFRFHSRWANYIARSAFAVYLIHKAPEIWGNFMRPEIYNLWQSQSLLAFTLAAIAITIGIYLLAMLIDPIRRYLSHKNRL